MPNWIAITIDTLREAKVAALVDACSTAALAAGQDDRAEGLIQGVVDEVRIAVASCPANRVDSDETTIPKSLKRFAVAMIIAELKNAIEEALTDDEKEALKYAQRQLAAVAACKLRVDQPDTPVTPEIEAGATIETLEESNSGATRTEMEGL